MLPENVYYWVLKQFQEISHFFVAGLKKNKKGNRVENPLTNIYYKPTLSLKITSPFRVKPQYRQNLQPCYSQLCYPFQI